MKKLYKCRWNKKIFGVFGGLGQAFCIDPNILRLAAIFLSILTGFFIVPLIYVGLSFVLQEGPYCFIEPSYKKVYKNPRNKIVFGVIAGFADYLKIDANFLRIIFALICVTTAFLPAMIVYFSANWLIPEQPNR